MSRSVTTECLWEGFRAWNSDKLEDWNSCQCARILWRGTPRHVARQDKFQDGFAELFKFFQKPSK